MLSRFVGFGRKIVALTLGPWLQETSPSCLDLVEMLKVDTKSLVIDWRNLKASLLSGRARGVLFCTSLRFIHRFESYLEIVHELLIQKLMMHVLFLF